MTSEAVAGLFLSGAIIVILIALTVAEEQMVDGGFLFIAKFATIFFGLHFIKMLDWVVGNSKINPALGTILVLVFGSGLTLDIIVMVYYNSAYTITGRKRNEKR